MSSLQPHSNRVSPIKRARADTAGNTIYDDPTSIDRLGLPALPRQQRAPPLKPTDSWMFKGLHPMYTRHIIQDKPAMMEIRCGQLGCTEFKPKEIKRVLSGTNNWKTHYKKCHSLIATSEADYLEQLKQQERLQASGSGNAPIFSKQINEQSHFERFRILLLEFVIKNNLSFSIVDQPETKALFTFLSPNTTQISRKTLMRDLKGRYMDAEEVVAKKLHQHIEGGGRIALTTDAWAGNNKLDYIAVTGHFNTSNGIQESLLLDIIELDEPVHSGFYLAKKLLEVTDRLNITRAIISITRDNASPNNNMLDEIESIVEEQFDIMNDFDQLRFPLKFNRVDGDVRCCAHIYNIAVQAGKPYFLIPSDL
jgi:hypothetical protein